MTRQRAIQAAVLILSLAGYIWLGYFTSRPDFIRLICLYAVLFGLYLYILFGKAFSNGFRVAIGGGILFRLSLFLMTPNLTDDYFRYIWDGLFIASGENPYLVMPSAFISSPEAVPGISTGLYEQLNSPNYYTAYPPVSQFLFGISAKLAGANVFGNILLFRGLILLAEFGSVALLYKLAKAFGRAPNAVLIYALNPLVIIELTGNLHLEAVMVFFLLLGVYLLVRERSVFSAICFGLAAGTKLIPLIFLPLLIKRLGMVRSLKYYLITGITLLVMHAPFFSTQAVSNYFTSLSLYFRVFEFNASIYYLLRWLDGLTSDGNIIPVSMVLLPVITFLAVIFIAWRENPSRQESIFTAMLFCLTAYYLLSTNIHPWHLTVLIMLSVFSDYRYMLPWSFGVVLSYFGYRTVPFSENLWLVAIEYLMAGGWMAYEFYSKLIQGRR